MIKIFGGVAKGFSLTTPSNNQTRPTSVLLRRKFFDSHQDLSDVCFVDLCAGTGSVGLEAVSRGAEKVFFVEQAKSAFRVLQANIKNFQSKYSVRTEIKAELADFSKWLNQNKEILDNSSRLIVFFDPPYEKIDLYEKFFEFFKNENLNVKLIIEACQQKTLSLKDFEERFGVYDKCYKQGSSFFVIYDF